MHEQTTYKSNPKLTTFITTIDSTWNHENENTHEDKPSNQGMYITVNRASVK